MRYALRTLLASLSLLPLQLGCAQWNQTAQNEHTLLRPATPSPDSVAIEIFFARLPEAERVIRGKLWDEVDEQHLSNELRRELSKNGFRAGLVGSQVPGPLAQLLQLDSSASASDGQVRPANLETNSGVRRSTMQLRSARHGEIQVSEVLDRIALLRVGQDGQVSGKPYDQAQGIFDIQASIQPDGRVLVHLIPELHYGQPIREFVAEDGIFRPLIARRREVFDGLGIESTLAPGQMLLISCLPDLPGSLGHHFFRVESSAGRQQKYLVVRLAQVPPTDLFANEFAPQPGSP